MIFARKKGIDVMRNFFAALGIFAFALALHGQEEDRKLPNFLQILADDQGWDELHRREGVLLLRPANS